MRKKCAGCKKASCDGCSLYPGTTISSIKNKAAVFPASFLPQKAEGYGIAVDLGTTTIAGVLFDLRTGQMLAAETKVNPQRKYGSDVISRITYAREGAGNASCLQQEVVQVLDLLAEALLCAVEVEPQEKSSADKVRMGFEDITEMVVAGNTAMCEILWNLDLEGLAAAPFHKEYEKALCQKGEDLGFSFLKNTRITVLPPIEGYVGADALSVYTYVKKIKPAGRVLAVDIGTNGEILLFGKEQVYAASAAAGPALEGAAVKCGMGAGIGAVEKVQIGGRFPMQDLLCKVIGDGTPKGICGSGLIDCLAALHQSGCMKDDGRLLTRQEAQRQRVPERLCRRLSDQEEQPPFQIRITDTEPPVCLDSEDIRQLQLAKGAIRAAMEILFQKEGMTYKELDALYLTGAFGNYIRTESAIEIGLLPPIEPDKVIAVHNAAGIGTAMALLCKKLVKEMEEDAARIRHVELAQEENFQALFLKYIDF